MDLKQLLEKYRQGELTDEEKAAFEQMLHSKESEESLQQLLDASLNGTAPVTTEETQAFLYQRIKEQYIKDAKGETAVQHIPRVHGFNYARLLYAAAAIIVLGFGAWFFIINNKKEQPLTAVDKQVQTDIGPGHDGAVLTLADGSQVVLDAPGNRVVASQNGAQVVLKNGSLVYEVTGPANRETIYNIMHTPKGRQFHLVLPDGSKVWLNAASSIRYPTVFTGAARAVEIDGEAYFEVATNKKMPFRVQIDSATEVEVLGTKFNIKAYDEEADVKTTLLEGKVKIVNRESSIVNRQSAILKPGQQAVFTHDAGLTTHDSRLTIHDKADLEQVMAWKNRLFNFNGYDIKPVMREIGRWYDLDIVYEGEPEPKEVMGELQRDLTLSQVMKILQKIHVKYRIEGRKLILMK